MEFSRRGCLGAAFGGRVVEGSVIPGAANVAIAWRLQKVMRGRLAVAEAEVGNLLKDSTPRLDISDGSARRRFLTEAELDAIAEWCPDNLDDQGAVVVLGVANIAAEEYKGLYWVARQAEQIFSRCSASPVTLVGQRHHVLDYGLDAVRDSGVEVDEEETRSVVSDLDVWDENSDQIWVRNWAAWKLRLPLVKAALLVERKMPKFSSE